MTRTLAGTFAAEADIVGATQAARAHGFRIVDVFVPYAVHGLDRAMGLRPSRLPWACLAFGVLGALMAVGIQFGTMDIDWPMNVGGKPRYSLPAYVPVIFETMVLLAGLGVVFVFLVRCRLFPGKEATHLFPGVTNDRFVLVLEGPVSGVETTAARQLFADFHALRVEERQE